MIILDIRESLERRWVESMQPTTWIYFTIEVGEVIL